MHDRSFMYSDLVHLQSLYSAVVFGVLLCKRETCDKTEWSGWKVLESVGCLLLSSLHKGVGLN